MQRALKMHLASGNDLKTFLLHRTAFLCVSRFLWLASFGTVNALMIAISVIFQPLFSVIPKIYYIYCLWVAGPYKGKGYAKALMEHCLADARTHGKSGVCMLGAEKQKAWLSDQSFARKFGFEVVDTTDNGYELLALSFDGTTPQFAHNAKKQRIESQALTVYYDMQCPFIPGNLEMIRQHCEAHGVPADFIEVDTLRKAKELPCVFNNWGVFYKGRFETVNLLDAAALERILKK